ncbi:hypothetical protein ACFQY0_18600 [Haloferula chungangensis]|uniref:Uncharacterized protein n=1 Tax=Haloferula chungangensis TaxID=1048331 RepID=A0ABW2L9U3_9BACT
MLMITDPVTRNGRIKVDPDRSENLSRLKTGYPKWRGRGVSGNDGDLFAEWSGTLPGTTAICEYDPGKSATFGIVVSPNQTVAVEIDSKTFKTYIAAANKLINSISEVKDPFKFNGSLKGSLSHCDMYDDGEALGRSLTLGGTDSIDCTLLDLKKVVPATTPAVSLRVGWKNHALTISISGNFEGKREPWIASNGSISGGCGASLTGEGKLGLATEKGDIGVVLGATGSKSIKANGIITGEKRTIYAQGSGEAGMLKVEGSLKVRFGPLGERQVGSVDFTIFESDAGETEKLTLISF